MHFPLVCLPQWPPVPPSAGSVGTIGPRRDFRGFVPIDAAYANGRPLPGGRAHAPVVAFYRPLSLRRHAFLRAGYVAYAPPRRWRAPPPSPTAGERPVAVQPERAGPVFRAQRQDHRSPRDGMPYVSRPAAGKRSGVFDTVAVSLWLTRDELAEKDKASRQRLAKAKAKSNG